ncbi:PREDICTED: GDSL esterase/lipase At1g29660-like [Tarenaya hassleriana]|uniref:GDSL esterase/lipase At1g29660-like n=1 Tax=Tarenaya hassleriana TaxID=28532 RepID=UPI00053C2AAD|nr:PREDICTED: GDSL esterase/lipase At1g29660-like [Tarenaya hassleriana]
MKGYLRKFQFVGLMLGVMLGIRVNGTSQVPCLFAFGDSLSDNGNNNRLPTLARANYLPYGIDFPGGPTGRFSNGKNFVDFMAELLGFGHYIPPYSEAKGEEMLSGLNYASGSAGIREESGQQLGERITFGRQVQNHKKVVSLVVDLIGGEEAAANHLKKCIYSITIGSNDYINNYFMPDAYPTSRLYTPEQYADGLIDLYGQQLNLLYNYGARKFLLSGLGTTGCAPNALARASPDGKTCVRSFNSVIGVFNDKLKSLIDRLNNHFSHAKFVYGNTYDIFQDLLNNSSAYGFKVTKEACCGGGRNHGAMMCMPGERSCPNRNEFVFWDSYHPTEATIRIVAQRLYRSRSPSDIYPIDISTLAQL